jgi:hypothetical protein
MNTTKTIAHTPGPWSVTYEEHGGYDCMTGSYDVRDKNKNLVALVDLGNYGQDHCEPATAETLARAERDARLIAAAPELLQLLAVTISHLDPRSELYGQVRRALAKAKGG